MSAGEKPSDFLTRLRATGMREPLATPPPPLPPPVDREPPRPSRVSETQLARALFATDPRILAIVARVEGPSAKTVDLLLRAWLVEHDVREECVARANAIFAVAGVGWDWSHYPGMRDVHRHAGLAAEMAGRHGSLEVALSSEPRR